MKKNIVFLFIMFLKVFSFAEENSNNTFLMDFRNQKITDIIYAIAEIFDESILIDETVNGNATFHFEDNSFESALTRFLTHCQLYVEKNDGMYSVSKVKLKIEDNKINLNTENVLLEPLLNILSRKTETTIMFDSLPNALITIRLKNASIEDVLNLAIVKLPGFALERIASGFYLSKTASVNTRRNMDVFNLFTENDLFSIAIQKANFVSVIDLLFKKAKKEYSLLAKTSIQFENIFYDNKDFDAMLKLLLEQSNCDFTITNGIYYIFEIQKKDVIKKFKETKIIKLKNYNIENLSNILPQELNGSSFIRFDKTSNSIILSGSNEELKPIEDFIKKIDVPILDSSYKRFILKNILVTDAVNLIPKSLLLDGAIIVPYTNSFITQVRNNDDFALEKFIDLIDNKKESYPIKLKYIQSSDLLKNLPPFVQKKNIVETVDSSLIFFSGNQNQFEIFKRDLELIDKPKQQIKYQILVIQRQKTNGINWSTKFSISNTNENASITHSSILSNIFNINFDIISHFGLQFAGSLNAELSEGKSRVLADTTLNGISGEAIAFSNTNTFRYRDIVVNTKGDLYTSTTREIASGLTLAINGWVSGDDMISVKIDAQVSKQGSSSSANTSSQTDTVNPPSTSEKKVSTCVRTKAGEPVIIGGLFQTETDSTEKRLPVLSRIPILGNLFKSKIVSNAETEFIIYLVPFVEKNIHEEFDAKKNLERIKRKYGNILDGKNDK